MSTIAACYPPAPVLIKPQMNLLGIAGEDRGHDVEDPSYAGGDREQRHSLPRILPTVRPPRVGRPKCAQVGEETEV